MTSVINFLSAESCTFLQTDQFARDRTSTSSTSAKQSAPSANHPVPTAKQSASKMPNNGARTSPHRAGKSPPRPTKKPANSYAKWDDFKTALKNVEEGREFQGETYTLDFGHNKDNPLNFVVSNMTKVEVDDGDRDVSVIIVEGFTTDIHESTLQMRFYLRRIDGEWGIHVIRPLSFQQYNNLMSSIDDAASAVFEYGDAERKKARKKNKTHIIMLNEVHYAVSEFYVLPDAPVDQDGNPLAYCRDFFHDKVDDEEDDGQDIPLHVAKEIVPGDVDVEGRYVDVKGEGKVPVSVFLFSLQFALKDSAENITTPTSSEDEEEDQELKRRKEVKRRTQAKKEEEEWKRQRAQAAADQRAKEQQAFLNERMREQKKRRGGGRGGVTDDDGNDGDNEEDNTTNPMDSEFQNDYN